MQTPRRLLERDEGGPLNCASLLELVRDKGIRGYSIGFSRDNGKESGNYYLWFRVSRE